MKFARIILLLAAATAAWWYGYARPSTPEQARLARLVATKGDIVRAIGERRAHLAQDQANVREAQLASFRAEHRGAEAAEAGRRVRAHAERLREDNIHQLNRLGARLAEIEVELRGAESPLE